MARVRIPLVVLGPDGRPLAGATAAVRKRSDGSAVNVYAAETGGTTLTAPQVVTDVGGRMAGWTDRGALEATITGPTGSGLAPYVVAWDALPAGDSSAEAAWIPDGLIATRMIPVGAVAYAALAADALAALIPIGSSIPYGGAALGALQLPAGGRFDWADGGLSDRATPGGASLYAAIGHTRNGGVDPGGNMVRRPDKRGRGSMGADSFGTAQGAASRLLVASGHPNALGQGGGAELVALTAAQNGPHTHLIPTRSANGGLTVDQASAAEGNSDQPLNAYASRSTSRGSIASTDGGGASGAGHKNVPPYEIDLWIVRVL